MNWRISLIKIPTVIVSTLFFAISAFGCECISGGTTDKERAEYYLSRADSVFTAKVVGFEYRKGVPVERLRSRYPNLSYETRMVQVEVNDWRKLEVATNLIINSLTAKISDGQELFGGCDFSFREGETYLIFATKRDGYFSTSRCSGSRLVKDNDPILEFLGPANKPKQEESLVFFSGSQLDIFS